MDTRTIDGVILTPLRQIRHPQGDVFHGMKKSDAGFAGFGEAYFSTVGKGDIKAWKKHREMTLNIIVPTGKIRFVLFDDRSTSPTKGCMNEFILSIDNYQRLTVPPQVWMAFQGLDDDNRLLNIASMEHAPDEMERLPIADIPYHWS
ncbi:MAG: dTDP-4-dehydrorhamnose 3,5-epimerase family protein [Prevotellaceae bacterium]|jgi:dTDP-4-dehydrorhamnose 3,5-epimerase|nr:dTDP-4-dehydrorhamnose 3,5-epimerase family protein [Prevotellaceae bacterium]